MTQTLKLLPVILCLAIPSLLLNACSNKDNDQEESPPPVAEKDEWKSHSTALKQIEGNNWSFCIGEKVYFGRGDRDHLIVFDLTANKWETSTIELPTGFKPRATRGIAIANNKAYIGGGFFANDNFLDWWQFDPAAANQWTPLRNCPKEQDAGAAFVHNGILYSGLAIGRDGDEFMQRRFYRYDIANNTWNLNPVKINSACGMNGFSFLLNNQFYYGAGQEETVDGVIETRKAARFDPATGTSQAIADFPEPLIAGENALSFTWNNKGYVLLEGSAMFQYDPASNKWKKLNNTPDEGGQHFIQYIHKSGERVFGFTRTGKVFEYIYK